MVVTQEMSQNETKQKKLWIRALKFISQLIKNA